MHMNVLDLMFSKEEIIFVKKRYPKVDLKDLGRPIGGFRHITSLKYLDSSLKHDIENNNFDNCKDPEAAARMCDEIRRKIRPFIGYERKRAL